MPNGNAKQTMKYLRSWRSASTVSLAETVCQEKISEQALFCLDAAFIRNLRSGCRISCSIISFKTRYVHLALLGIKCIYHKITVAQLNIFTPLTVTCNSPSHTEGIFLCFHCKTSKLRYIRGLFLTPGLRLLTVRTERSGRLIHP
jgi:hypothetical protein